MENETFDEEPRAEKKILNFHRFQARIRKAKQSGEISSEMCDLFLKMLDECECIEDLDDRLVDEVLTKNKELRSQIEDNNKRILDLEQEAYYLRIDRRAKEPA